MSKEWSRYAVACRGCGNAGELSMWMDDWNRWGSDWIGFKGRVYLTGPEAKTIQCNECGGADIDLDRKPD